MKEVGRVKVRKGGENVTLFLALKVDESCANECSSLEKLEKARKWILPIISTKKCSPTDRILAQ